MGCHAMPERSGMYGDVWGFRKFNYMFHVVEYFCILLLQKHGLSVAGLFFSLNVCGEIAVMQLLNICLFCLC